MRAGFRALLDAQADIEVVAEAVDGEEAIELARRHRPDVVLMDVRMPRTDGLRATARLTADPALSGTRVIVLTTFELDEYVFGALRAGAAGFMLKDVEPAELVDAVRVVAAGEALLMPRHTRRLIEAFVAQAEAGRRATTPCWRSSRRASARCSRSSGRALQPRDRRGARALAADGEDARRRLFTKLGARPRQLVVLPTRPASWSRAAARLTPTSVEPERRPARGRERLDGSRRKERTQWLTQDPRCLMALGLVLWLAVTATLAGISIQVVGMIVFFAGLLWP